MRIRKRASDMSHFSSWPSARLGELADWGPAIIGGTGGSGTRAFARLLRRAGMYIGTELNESDDALEFGKYSDRWINAVGQLGAAELPAEMEAEMLSDLGAVIERHLGGLGEPRPWGWKEPRSAYLLGFFVAHLPCVRFLHVVRDGRDMAFSGNQNQLRKHGSVIGLPDRKLSQPAQSLKLWSWLNLRTARFGAAALGGRYMRVRFEDLCRDPVAVGRQVINFVGLDADVTITAAEVKQPATIGRWRSHDPRILEELACVGADALREFGYE